MIFPGILIIGISLLIYNNYVELNIYSESDSEETRRNKRVVASYVTFGIGIFIISFWSLDYLKNIGYISTSDDVFNSIIIVIFLIVCSGFLLLIRRKKP